MEVSHQILARRQNLGLAIRQEIGWPPFRPANDCICFASGRPVDFECGTELARLSEQLRKDIIYTSWAKVRARRPVGFALVFRDRYSVDVATQVIPWAADTDSPVLFLNIRMDETFVIDGRGSLTRVAGLPSNTADGHRLALRRINATAAAMGDDLLKGNQLVPPGGDWIEPTARAGAVVSFN